MAESADSAGGLTGAAMPSPEPALNERSRSVLPRETPPNSSCSTCALRLLACRLQAGGCFVSSTTGRPSELQISIPRHGQDRGDADLLAVLQQESHKSVGAFEFCFHGIDSCYELRVTSFELRVKPVETAIRDVRRCIHLATRNSRLATPLPNHGPVAGGERGVVARHGQIVGSGGM